MTLKMCRLCRDQFFGEPDKSERAPPGTPLHSATREVTQTRSRQAGIAPHTDANATALPTRATRSIVRLRAMSCGAILKRHAPPEWAPARLSHTARRCREHAQSVPRASSFCSSRPQSRPSVSRQHCGCKEHSSSEPLGLERPAALAAALEQRPAGSVPMVPEAHEVVQAAVDSLRAASSISWQRLVASLP